jgi:ribosomal protein S11
MNTKSQTTADKRAKAPKRKERKNITSGDAHVNATFNNTHITITDAQGNTIAWSTAGHQASKAAVNRRLMPPRLPPTPPPKKRWNTA